jgi:Protein of unknown function (DUF2934)
LGQIDAPTFEQIRQAAFSRWLRRGRLHGFDREDWLAAEDDLTLSLNYQTIADYPLDGPGRLVHSERPDRYCRFCERTAGQVDFGPPRPLLAAGRSPSLYTAAICERCQTTFRDAQTALLERFRGALAEDASRCAGVESMRALGIDSLGVFKSLVGCALSIMPESELGYFVDALEWVSNPDIESDRALFEADATCLVYLAPFLGGRSWTSIARRIDKDVPVPYMVYFLALSGVVMQIPLPLCMRDQDLDVRMLRAPRRSFVAGDGDTFEQARVLEFPVRRRGNLDRYWNQLSRR